MMSCLLFITLLILRISGYKVRHKKAVRLEISIPLRFTSQRNWHVFPLFIDNCVTLYLI